jgi:60 kDa SS-A/Ro ribonucleoprotein
MKYAILFNRRKTPQMQPIPGQNQVQNSAGGFVYALDRWARLDRFLILGSDSGTYYATPQALTQENAQHVIALTKEDGEAVVRRTVAVSVAGRAPKNDPAIFALALVASFGDDKARASALSALPTVCRTGTHLFQFAAAVDGLRGWGRGLRRAVGDWYNAKKPTELEYQLLKYQGRNGWTNRDLLRLAHPKPRTEAHDGLFNWATGKSTPLGASRVVASSRLHAGATPAEAAKVIREAMLPREAVPTEMLNHAEVWEALLEAMPLTAMVRNLATMTRVGLLTPGSEAARQIVATLGDAGRIRKARVHPMALLIAQRTYSAGRGFKGKSSWTPVPAVVDALDAAFYLAFANVEPTRNRYLLGVDVSGSMSWQAPNSAISACEAATAMAMVTVATEEAVTPMAFADSFRPLPLSRRMRLDDALKHTRDQNFGRTDCALPMAFAAERRVPVDVFVVYTDNETWAGNVHPSQALRAYRQQMGIAAKLIVVGITATKFTIADPNDAGMLDIVGFDASVPEVMADFARS